MADQNKSIRPKILLMTHQIPYPRDIDGGIVVVFPILEYLSADYDIDVVCPVFNNDQLESDRLKALRPYCRNVFTFKVSKSFFKRLWIVMFHRLPLVLYLYSFRQIKKDILSKIKPHLHEYKAILVQDRHLAPFVSRFDAHDHTTKVLVQNDYLTLNFKRIAECTESVFRKLYSWISFRKLVKVEPQIYREFDSVIYVSSEDKRTITSRYPDMDRKIVVIPNGINMAKYRRVPPTSASSSNSILFTGNMRYPPNRQAVVWFYRNVFNDLKKECPGIIWNIVGRYANDYIRIDDPQVLIHASVPSLIPYLQDATIVISPLQSGTGLKNKVIEAMACGKVVVGSRLSFDGIPIRNGVEAIMALKISDYLVQIKNYIKNAAERKEVGKNAVEFIRANFDIARTVERWRQVIEARGKQ